jgi:hypothetical protein
MELTQAHFFGKRLFSLVGTRVSSRIALVDSLTSLSFNKFTNSSSRSVTLLPLPTMCSTSSIQTKTGRSNSRSSLSLFRSLLEGTWRTSYVVSLLVVVELIPCIYLLMHDVSVSVEECTFVSLSSRMYYYLPPSYSPGVSERTVACTHTRD